MKGHGKKILRCAQNDSAEGSVTSSIPLPAFNIRISAAARQQAVRNAIPKTLRVLKTLRVCDFRTEIRMKAAFIF